MVQKSAITATILSPLKHLHIGIFNKYTKNYNSDNKQYCTFIFYKQTI